MKNLYLLQKHPIFDQRLLCYSYAEGERDIVTSPPCWPCTGLLIIGLFMSWAVRGHLTHVKFCIYNSVDRIIS